MDAEQSEMPPERIAALAQADSLNGDEQKALAFLLECPFPDARLKAAQWIESRAVLEKVLHAMRNSDRRVEKLVHQKLEILDANEQAARLARQAIAHAANLLGSYPLMVNQVADLDRQWNEAEAAGKLTAAASEEFSGLRSRLGERLEAQAELQRSVRRLSEELRKLTEDANDPSRLPDAADVLGTLDRLEHGMADLCASPEAPSLPKKLLREFAEKHSALRDAIGALEERHDAIDAREQLLKKWESRSPATLKEAALQTQWDALPASHDQLAEALGQRFAALLTRVREHQTVVQAGKEAQRHESRQAFDGELAALQAAVQAGSSHAAVEHDAKLRSMNTDKLNLSSEVRGQLTQLRSELAHMQGWAKWGGAMSREELYKRAVDMPTLQLPVAELAKQVSTLREQWKALDATAGPAGKEAWLRFDAACSLAYAPAAEHFKKLSQERHDNLEKARKLLQETQAAAERVEQAGEDGTDWKALAGTCDRLSQQWHRLGPIDRKPKKALDADFATAMKRLSGPLVLRQTAEKQERERLIEAVASLDPAQRQATDRLRELQQRWQQRASQLPLQRHDEHALWTRFRAACDELFARRKRHAKAADAERHGHVEEREAICARLETAGKDDSLQPAALREQLREGRTAWTRSGPVPHGVQRQLETRFEKATKAVQARLEHAERGARQARADTLIKRLALCQRAENALVHANDDEFAQANEAWSQLPAVASEPERVLLARFDAALAAHASADGTYAEHVRNNKAILQQELLRAEITLGMESPAAFSRERLKLQVELLQASLKSGQKPQSPADALLKLCRLPAQSDAADQLRLTAVLARLS